MVYFTSIPYRWLLLPLLLLSCALATRGLDLDGLRGDEVLSIGHAGGLGADPLSPFDIWNNVSTRSPGHVPGYFILLGAWGNLVGWAPPALRILSLFIGLLTVSITYRLGADTISPRVGFYAAVILCSSVFLIHYMHEIRQYTLVAFLTALEVWIYYYVITKPKAGALAWTTLALTTTGLLYTHYFAAAIVGVIALYHLFVVKKDRQWWRVVIIFALAGVLFLPWITTLIRGVTHATGREEIITGALRIRRIVPFLTYLFGNGAPLLLAGVGLAALPSLRKPTRGMTYIWFTTLGLFIVLVAANEILRLVTPSRLRYFIGLWPLGAIIIALGFNWLSSWRVFTFALLIIWVLVGTFYSINPDAVLRRMGVRPFPALNILQEELTDRAQVGDLVVGFTPREMHGDKYINTVDYYLQPLGLRSYFPDIGGRDLTPAMTEDIEQTIMDQPDLWVAYMFDTEAPPIEALKAILAEGYIYCETVTDRPDLVLEYYVHSESSCSP